MCGEARDDIDRWDKKKEWKNEYFRYSIPPTSRKWVGHTSAFISKMSRSCVRLHIENESVIRPPTSRKWFGHASAYISNMSRSYVRIHLENESVMRPPKFRILVGHASARRRTHDRNRQNKAGLMTDLETALFSRSTVRYGRWTEFSVEFDIRSCVQSVMSPQTERVYRERVKERQTDQH